MSKIKIVDDIMGAGKSAAAINYINSTNDKHFLVITPYLDEIKRYKQACHSKHFKEPIYDGGTKLDNLKELIKNGENIVSTHSLFHRFDKELIEICQILDYTLIMDEVTDVVEEYDISPDDISTLMEKYCILNNNGLMVWRDEQQSYEGKFSEIKNMCNLGGLAVVRQKMFLWLFPIEVFNAFDEIYILTYMFNAQIQRYYYDFYKTEYEYYHVAGETFEEYEFMPGKSLCSRHKYNELIHILDNEKMNIIGNDSFALSHNWYEKNKSNAIIKKLKNNLQNYFHNIVKKSSSEIIWTTFKDYRNLLKGKGYTKSFLPINARATNLYKNRDCIAYLVNIFFNPMVKGFFQDHGVDIDEDGYALSEMLQWIWRSAIRDGREVWIYIPSRRMRRLLQYWITENSTSFK